MVLEIRNEITVHHVFWGGLGVESKLPNTNCDQTTKWKISKHSNYK